MREQDGQLLKAQWRKLEFEQICYFALWFCSDLLFLLSNLFRSVIPGSPVSNGVVPTDLGQVVKYRSGGDTNKNVVAEEIRRWRQYKSDTDSDQEDTENSENIENIENTEENGGGTVLFRKMSKNKQRNIRKKSSDESE